MFVSRNTTAPGHLYRVINKNVYIINLTRPASRKTAFLFSHTLLPSRLQTRGVPLPGQGSVYPQLWLNLWELRSSSSVTLSDPRHLVKGPTDAPHPLFSCTVPPTQSVRDQCPPPRWESQQSQAPPVPGRHTAGAQ